MYNGILLKHKKEQNFTIDLEGIILSEVSQTNTLRHHLFLESKRYNKLVNITKKKQIHRYREQTRSY